MSQKKQSQAMKNLRNGRSLRLEGLEARQLLSVNMLGAMQNDTAGSEVVSSETSTLDCTEAAMLAIAQQTAPQSYAAAQMTELLPAGNVGDQGTENAETWVNSAVKYYVSASLNTETLPMTDVAINFSDLEDFSDADYIEVSVIDSAGTFLKYLSLDNDDGVWDCSYDGIFEDNTLTFSTFFHDVDSTFSVNVRAYSYEWNDEGNAVYTYSKDSVSTFTIPAGKADQSELEDMQIRYDVEVLEADAENNYASIQLDFTDMEAFYSARTVNVDIMDNAGSLVYSTGFYKGYHYSPDQWICGESAGLGESSFYFQIPSVYCYGDQFKINVTAHAKGFSTQESIESFTLPAFTFDDAENVDFSILADQEVEYEVTDIIRSEDSYRPTYDMKFNFSNLEKFHSARTLTITIMDTIGNVIDTYRIFNRSHLVNEPEWIGMDEEYSMSGEWDNDSGLFVLNVQLDGSEYLVNVTASDGEAVYTSTDNIQSLVLPSDPNGDMWIPETAPELADLKLDYTVTVSDNDLRIDFANLEEFNTASKIMVSIMDQDGNELTSLEMYNEADPGDSPAWWVDYVYGQDALYCRAIHCNCWCSNNAVGILNLHELVPNTEYQINITATDGYEFTTSMDSTQTFRTGKAAFDSAYFVYVGANEESARAVDVYWGLPQSAYDRNGDPVWDNAPKNFTITLYTVTEDTEGNVSYKKAKTVTVRNLTGDEGYYRYTVTGLKSETCYTATVKADAANGMAASLETPVSCEDSDTTLAELPKLNLQTETVTDESVVLNIRNAAAYGKYMEEDSEEGLEFYVTYTEGNSKEVQILGDWDWYVDYAAGTLTIDHLKANTNYKFNISASADYALTSAPTTVSIKTEKTAYAVPLEVYDSEVTDSTLTVNWDLVKHDRHNDDLDSPVLKYTVTYTEVNANGTLGKAKNTTVTLKKDAETGTCTIKGLKSKTTYLVTVCAAASNTHSASEASDVIEVRTYDKLPKLSLQKKTVADEYVVLDIRNLKNYSDYIDVETGELALDFVITYTEGNSKEVQILDDWDCYVDCAAGTLTIEGLKANTNYKFNIRALDDIAATPVTTISIKTEKTAYDYPLAEISAVTDSTLTVNWGLVAMDRNFNDVPTAMKYTVTYTDVKADGTLGKAKNVTVTLKNGAEFGEYTIKGLNPKTTYQVSISAAASKTNSASESVIVDTVTTYDKLPKLTLQKGEITDESAVLDIRNIIKYADYIDAGVLDFSVTYTENKEVMYAEAEYVDGKLVITGLNANTSYKFNVSAFMDTDTNKAVTPVASVSVKTEKTAYAAPELEIIDVTDSTLTVIWDLVSTDRKDNEVPAAMKYTVSYVAVDADGNAVGNAKNTTVTLTKGAEFGEYTIKGLKANTTYMVTVSTAASSTCSASKAIGDTAQTAEKMQTPTVRYYNDTQILEINCGIAWDRFESFRITGIVSGRGTASGIHGNFAGEGYYDSTEEEISGFAVTVSAYGYTEGAGTIYVTLEDGVFKLDFSGLYSEMVGSGNLMITSITGTLDSKEVAWNGSVSTTFAVRT